MATPGNELIILVADNDARETLRCLLEERRESLGIREFGFEFISHVNRDSGCYRECEGFLRAYSNRFEHALVLFDHHGCGREGYQSAGIERDVESRLHANGWINRAAAIVLDPELEAWVWSESPRVLSIFGTRNPTTDVRQLLSDRGWLRPPQQKPENPKEVMRQILHENRKPLSPAIFQQLARTIDFSNCQDRAFLKLRRIMLSWFPR